MTTRLAGPDTRFLPFNRGTDAGGAGNPLNSSGSPSSYLWERVLQRDSLLAILGRFMYIKHETHTDPISGKRTKSSTLRFPASTSGRRSPASPTPLPPRAPATGT